MAAELGEDAAEAAEARSTAGWRSETGRQLAMEQSGIEAKIADLLVDVVGLKRDDITMEARLEDDLEVDSLDVIELLMALEDNFDIKIPDEEAGEITTVREMTELVSQKLNG